jgi:hypothetical protein
MKLITTNLQDLRKKPLEYARRARSPVKPSKPPRLRREATLQAGLAIEKSLLSIAEPTPSTSEGQFRTGIAMRPYQAEDAARICGREADVRRPGSSGPIGYILGYHMGSVVVLHSSRFCFLTLFILVQAGKNSCRTACSSIWRWLNAVGV